MTQVKQNQRGGERKRGRGINFKYWRDNCYIAFNFYDYRAIVNKMVETSAEIDNVIQLLVETKVSNFISSNDGC
jgi:hypothetical protein